MRKGGKERDLFGPGVLFLLVRALALFREIVPPGKLALTFFFFFLLLFQFLLPLLKFVIGLCQKNSPVEDIPARSGKKNARLPKRETGAA